MNNCPTFSSIESVFRVFSAQPSSPFACLSADGWDKVAGSKTAEPEKVNRARSKIGLRRNLTE
jgi:hypothetical protein